mmetsp:Transcript_40205/g.46117  ORF Transcript_40205/g.46117 Transcript_40205/m.46117 type:complete len:80 (-) Transcript_40205:134-373(-)
MSEGPAMDWFHQTTNKFAQEEISEKLDEDPSENQKGDEPAKNEKLFKILDPKSFSSDISAEIVYNRPTEEVDFASGKYR